ncbi:MAG: MerR family transcriptional regulator [Sphingomonas sp.]|nr:MerR family transcriptional regulator [Sphingomonas sp.]
MSDKAAGAYRTIGELSQEIGVRQHILRYWETRFPQLRPLQRAGGRRYYRPEDVELVRRIHRLLSQDGYTIRGVLALLNNDRRARASAPGDHPSAALPVAVTPALDRPPIDRAILQSIRDLLAAALEADRAAAA